MTKRAARWLLALGACSIVAASPPAGSVNRGSSDRMIMVAPHRALHLRCDGSGPVTIVLNAGEFNFSASWAGVQPTIAKLTRVCSWDRPGYGTSDPPIAPLDVKYVASQLDLLLRTANIPPPYVLVGHSYGGFEALMFAHKYPVATVAVILEEPSYPHQERILTRADPGNGHDYEMLRRNNIRETKACLAMASTENEKCMGQSKTFLRSQLSILENWNQSSREVESISSLGSMPIYVLTAENTGSDHPKMAEAWRNMHDRYARLSTNGVHILVPGSGHVIHRERPEVLVQTVREVLTRLKKSCSIRLADGS